MKGSYKIENGYVVIRQPINIKPYGRNAQSVLLASTAGAETFDHNGEEVRVNLFVWVTRDKWEKVSNMF